MLGVATSTLALLLLVLVAFVCGRWLLALPGRVLTRIGAWNHARQMRALARREREAEVRKKEAEAENEAARFI